MVHVVAPLTTSKITTTPRTQLYTLFNLNVSLNQPSCESCATKLDGKWSRIPYPWTIIASACQQTPNCFTFEHFKNLKTPNQNFNELSIRKECIISLDEEIYWRNKTHMKPMTGCFFVLFLWIGLNELVQYRMESV